MDGICRSLLGSTPYRSSNGSIAPKLSRLELCQLTSFLRKFLRLVTSVIIPDKGSTSFKYLGNKSDTFRIPRGIFQILQ